MTIVKSVGGHKRELNSNPFDRVYEVAEARRRYCDRKIGRPDRDRLRRVLRSSIRRRTGGPGQYVARSALRRTAEVNQGAIEIERNDLEAAFEMTDHSCAVRSDQPYRGSPRATIGRRPPEVPNYLRQPRLTRPVASEGGRPQLSVVCYSVSDCDFICSISRRCCSISVCCDCNCDWVCCCWTS